MCCRTNHFLISGCDGNGGRGGRGGGGGGGGARDGDAEEEGGGGGGRDVARGGGRGGTREGDFSTVSADALGMLEHSVSCDILATPSCSQVRMTWWM